MLATVCHRHGAIVPDGERCQGCAQDQQARRGRRNRELGRDSAHWRKISARRRRLARGACAVCGGTESDEDPGSKLTVDLVGSRDHTRARLEDTVAKCRRCHPRTEGCA